MNFIHEKNTCGKIIDSKTVIRALIQEKWLNYGQKR